MGAVSVKILLIGTLPPPVGGTTVSLRHLVRALENRLDVRIRVVNTGGIRGTRLQGARQFMRVLRKIAAEVRAVDVVTLHVGLHALPLLGPFVLLICRLYGKPLMIRRFGGMDHRELKGISYLAGNGVIRRADLYLVQTKALKRAAIDAGLERVEWFPTSRPLSGPKPETEQTKTVCKHFIFLGHLRATKGITEIMTAAERLPEDVSVHVYGPFYDGLNEDMFRQCKRVQYCGVVEPDAVPEVLSRHDALLLPTYYEGEGYPGVILEAFNAGLPVITTLWKEIPEIVDDSCGVLIPPRDAEALFQAMSALVGDEQFYRKLCRGALGQRTLFNFEQWTEYFVGLCQNMAPTMRDNQRRGCKC